MPIGCARARPAALDARAMPLSRCACFPARLPSLRSTGKVRRPACDPRSLTKAQAPAGVAAPRAPRHRRAIAAPQSRLLRPPAALRLQPPVPRCTHGARPALQAAMADGAGHPCGVQPTCSRELYEGRDVREEGKAPELFAGAAAAAAWIAAATPAALAPQSPLRRPGSAGAAHGRAPHRDPAPPGRPGACGARVLQPRELRVLPARGPLEGPPAAGEQPRSPGGKRARTGLRGASWPGAGETPAHWPRGARQPARHPATQRAPPARPLVLQDEVADFSWRGTWQRSFVGARHPKHKLPPRGAPPAARAPGLFSDLLYQPWLCAHVDIAPEWLEVDNIERWAGGAAGQPGRGVASPRAASPRPPD
jgi:hypothetical protein